MSEYFSAKNTNIYNNNIKYKYNNNNNNNNNIIIIIIIIIHSNIVFSVDESTKE